MDEFRLPAGAQLRTMAMGMIVGLVASGHTTDDILTAHPCLVEQDIRQALAYRAWRVEEFEVLLPTKSSS